MAYGNSNYSSYTDRRSASYASIQATVPKVLATLQDPTLTMIGEYTEILRSTFQQSRSLGKPWQIWAQQTSLGPNIGFDLTRCSEVITNKAVAAGVQKYCNGLLASASGGTFRAFSILNKNSIPWDTDDYNGYQFERAKILNMLKDNTHNAIILGGDLHDSWVWTMYENGASSGTPVALNLIGPGVTSPGFGPFLGYSFLASPNVTAALGGSSGVYKFLSDMLVSQNPGLNYANIQKKGFVAVKLTPHAQVAEFILNKESTTVTNFTAARALTGGITGEFSCDTSLLTKAGSAGQALKQDACEIQFDTTRPAVWSLPVPILPLLKATPLTNCGMDACKVRVH